MKPDTVAWHIMFDALANESMIDDLDQLYKIVRTGYMEDHIHIRVLDHLIVYRANLDNLQVEVLAWLVDGLSERWAFALFRSSFTLVPQSQYL